MLTGMRSPLSFCCAAILLCGILCGLQPVLAATADRPDVPVLSGQERLARGARASSQPRVVHGERIGMADAVRRALRDNPALGASAAQSGASEEGRLSQMGQFGPSLSMSYTASKQEQWRNPSSAAAATPDLGTYTWKLSVRQSLFTGFRLLAEYQKAALQAESDRASLRQAELEKTQAVQTAFLKYLYAVENCRSEREALARLRDQLKITRAFYDVGLRPRLDVLQAEVDVSSAERVLLQTENNRDTYMAELNALLGLDVSSTPLYVGELKHVPFARRLEECLEAAYRQRPDVFVAARSVQIAAKDRESVRSEYYPQVEAYYTVSRAGNTPGLERAGDHGSRSDAWEAGVQATWNMFQWGTTYHADQKAGLLVSKVRREEENLRLEVGYTVKTCLLAVREAEKRIAVAETSVAQAQEAYAAALACYQEQVGTNFDVLDASSKLLAAQASLTSAKADYLTALSKMYVAMGEYRPDLLAR